MTKKRSFAESTLGLICAALVSTSPVALAAAEQPTWPVLDTTGGEGENQDGLIFEVLGAEGLKHTGESKICALFVKFAEAGGDYEKPAAWLIGMHEKKTLWKIALPIKEWINPDHTLVFCDHGNIVVTSECAGSTAYCKQIFSWNGHECTLIGTECGDPSQDIVNNLKKIGTNGSAADLQKWDREYHYFPYPSNYLTFDNISNILSSGHAAAIELERAGKHNQAATRLDIAFEASQRLISLQTGYSDLPKPQKWIKAWQTEGIYMPAQVWGPMLADYAEILKRSGKRSEARKVRFALRSALQSY